MQYILTLCSLAAVLVLSAQPRAELGVFGGLANYFGDLESEDQLPDFDLSQFAAGLYVAKNLSYPLQIRGEVLYASIQGRDALQPEADLRNRAYSFTNTLYAGELQVLWEPFARRRYPEKGGYKNIVSPYLLTGFGTAISSPDTRYGNPGTDGFPERVKEDQTARKSPVLQFPFGGGLRFDLSKSVSLGLEVITRKTFSDQLDGVAYSGNPGADDWYITGGLTLAYRWSTPDYDRDGFLDSLDHCPKLAGVDYTTGCPDADGDLIPDAQDRCPYQAGKAKAQGCPDSDYDQVPDFMDDCPNYPGDISGRGCPDSDGDGLVDEADMCPHCPGKVTLSGCPDADGDGVADGRDRCPNLAGDSDTDGCPYTDTDRDGIPDETDRCPDIAGTLAQAGCPDTDGDGLADGEDKCPTVNGRGSKDGCPVVSQELKDRLALFTEAVQFETGSDQLKASSETTLTELVDILQTYTYYNLRIEGHTDSQGKASNNLQLSKDRARACYDFLVAQGITAERLQHTGYGETRPIADNGTAAGRRKNRRVAFELFVP